MSLQLLGDTWGIFLSHPWDFAPVFTTELGRTIKLALEFAKRNYCGCLFSDNAEHILPRANDMTVDESPEELRFLIADAQSQDFAILLGILELAENDKRDVVVSVCPRGVQLEFSLRNWGFLPTSQLQLAGFFFIGFAE